MLRQPGVGDGSNLSESNPQSAVVQGTLQERPFPRLLQQLYRKRFTGYFTVTDQTQDESEVYLREGAPVHVRRPVDTDRLGNLLLEYGVVSPEILAAASAQVTDGLRLGDVLERMGALDKQRLAQALKAQMIRKLTRLFFVAEGTYAVFPGPHAFGDGDEWDLMRVDPRSVLYAGIRAAYTLARAAQELSRLLGQRFRLTEVSPGFLAAMGIATEDQTVEALRKGWMTLDGLDSVTSRPLEVRAIVLALYYADLLHREPVAQNPAGVPLATGVERSQPWELSGAFKLPADTFSTLPAVADSANGKPLPAGPPAGSTGQPSIPVGSAVLPRSAEGARPVPGSTRPSGFFPSVAAAGGAPGGPDASKKSSGERPGGAGRAPITGTVLAEVTSQPRSLTPVHGTPSTPPDGMREMIQEMSQKLGRVTHFELLGISQNATSDEVGTAFVRAARQFHPDRLAGAGLQDLQPLAERILARINEAAMVLGNSTRRADYVASLSPGARPAETSLPTVLEAENFFLKGEVYLKKRDYGKAVELFTMATQGNPSEPQYRAYLAWARFDDPRARKETLVRETLKIMDGVVRERPKFARGFYWTGQLWKFLNETDKAEVAFREAVRVDTSFIEASRELRLIEMRKGKSTAAKAGTKSDPPRGGLMGKLFKK